MSSSKHDWHRPTFLDPASIENTDTRQGFIPATDIPPDEAEAVDETPETGIPEPKKQKSTWPARALTASLIALLSLAVGAELYRLLDWSFGLHTLLGTAVASLIIVCTGCGLWQLRRSLKGLRQLRHTRDLRTEAQRLSTRNSHGGAAHFLNRLEAHYRDHPQQDSIIQQIHQVDSSYNDAEVIRFLSSHALTKQDKLARACIRKHSLAAGTLVALSPWASFDMLLAGWRNLRMLREIMSIYGVAPGASAQIRLLKQVFHSIAFAGISDLALDAGSTFLGTGLTSGLSSRASQGLGAGLFTARTGLTAMELCRPLPFNVRRNSVMKRLAGELVTQLATGARTSGR
ncbi:TIGR01620 family protein [Marinobacterium sp. AK62]|uniref:TIGR01620 family protein n=1 Tax=Marinobacterium alkalitolerans TaxID=1542925 RepID=A0ABS3ZET9_9GAMM|nr:TIGR01620 family protein [Marinobacterium alkalitolerans]MBP0049559.1 TIGR01620 family protein [Marinobacterium alkalitolerans]